MGHAKVAGFQRDEVYVGTPEERAAGQKPDHSVHPGREFTMGTAITAPVGASGNAPAGVEDALLRLANKETFTVRRERIVNNIKHLPMPSERRTRRPPTWKSRPFKLLTLKRARRLPERFLMKTLSKQVISTSF